MSRNIEIIIGTYEEFLLGYTLEYKNGEQTLVQSFADKSHAGSIKCLAVQGKYIATGSTDDRIFIYDMQKRKQSQILLNHEGTVNSIAFTSDNTHIISAGDDGRMVAVRLNTWQVGANWKKAHNGSAVTCISCHPSGKLALSLGSDLVLRTWNLVKGRVAYKTNLKNKPSLGRTPDCLSWSPSGNYFTIAGPRELEVWCIKKADVYKSEKTVSKPVCICWASDNLVLAGLEDGSVIFVSINNDKQTETVKVHEGRVKAICLHDYVVVTASSLGEVKMWTINVEQQSLTQLAVASIGCRPTCMGILDLDQFGIDYNKKEEESCKDEVENIKVEAQVPQERGIVTIEFDEEKEEAEEDDVESDIEQRIVSKPAKKRKSNENTHSRSAHAKLLTVKKAKKKLKKNETKSTTEPGAFVRLRKGNK